ncbi:hypothetical protein K432DRAFT_379415 [Lepidopterella palustris CBS 459.81]|uniref:Uncharacterized protein n=1 Tax=Lepidopterella palustris CBS 459.81 TaxID=1314670 RepID=A0A8E2JI72_9PEZI|nr:hypothetical protein K432DRAFT_379415 [Lepidopterella palustris CBS 459.81]
MTTIPIAYKVLISNFGQGDERLRFSFNILEHCPSILFNPPSAGAVRRIASYAERSFLTELVQRHDNELLTSHAWACSICGKQSRVLYHCALDWLSKPAMLNFEGGLLMRKKTVFVVAIPVCHFRGECELQVIEILAAGHWHTNRALRA